MYYFLYVIVGYYTIINVHPVPQQYQYQYTFSCYKASQHPFVVRSKSCALLLLWLAVGGGARHGGEGVLLQALGSQRVPRRLVRARSPLEKRAGGVCDAVLQNRGTTNCSSDVEVLYVGESIRSSKVDPTTSEGVRKASEEVWYLGQRPSPHGSQKVKIKHIRSVNYIYFLEWFTMHVCRAFRTAERFGRRCRREGTAARDPFSKKHATKTRMQPPQGRGFSRNFPRCTSRLCCHS